VRCILRKAAPHPEGDGIVLLDFSKYSINRRKERRARTSGRPMPGFGHIDRSSRLLGADPDLV